MFPRLIPPLQSISDIKQKRDSIRDAAEASPVLKQGFLHKKGHFRTNWKNRWWKLQGKNLFYFKKMEDAKHLGVLHLPNYTIQKFSKEGRPFSLALTGVPHSGAKDFEVSAASEADRDDWFSLISRLTSDNDDDPSASLSRPRSGSTSDAPPSSKRRSEPRDKNSSGGRQRSATTAGPADVGAPQRRGTVQESLPPGAAPAAAMESLYVTNLGSHLDSPKKAPSNLASPAVGGPMPAVPPPPTNSPPPFQSAPPPMVLTVELIASYRDAFATLDKKNQGFIDSTLALDHFKKSSTLPKEVLDEIWSISVPEGIPIVTLQFFSTAAFFIRWKLQGNALPKPPLPDTFKESLGLVNSTNVSPASRIRAKSRSAKASAASAPAPTPEAFLPVSDWIIPYGDFKIHRDQILGKGSFATVYKGSYKHKPIAVKSARLNSEKRREEFMEEVLVMCQLEDHPNVLHLLGVSHHDKDNQRCYILMDFMKTSLAYLVYKDPEFRKTLVPRKLYEIALQIAEGMVFLHKSNVIHRDLATRNVLVAEDGRCVICDFGMARKFSEDEEKQYLMTDTNIVPVRWASPEAILLKYSRASDVWSFGCLLVECITGIVPYPNHSAPSALIVDINAGLLPPLPEDVDPLLNEICQRCWRREPSERITFEQIVHKLTEALVLTAPEAPPV